MKKKRGLRRGEGRGRRQALVEYVASRDEDGTFFGFLVFLLLLLLLLLLSVLFLVFLEEKRKELYGIRGVSKGTHRLSSEIFFYSAHRSR